MPPAAPDAPVSGRLPDLPVLEGAIVRLRPWRPDDTATVLAASLDPFIPTITTVPADTDEAGALEFIERQIARPRTDLGHARAVADRTTDTAIGHVYVSLLQHRLGRATLGYWVLDAHRGKGVATEALRLATRWALDDVGLARTTLYIEPWNEGSRRVAVGAGYHEEALLAAWETYDDGVARDMLSYTCLRDSTP